MHKPSRKSWRRLTATLLVVVSLVALTGCEKDFRAKQDAIQCIYNKNGELKKVLPAGSEKYTGEDSYTSYLVPASDRFYNVDPNDGIRDAGAPKYVTGYAFGDKDVLAIIHVHFKFDQSQACPRFVDQHMRRNIPEKVLGNGDIEDKMGFDVRNPEEALRYVQQQPGETAEQLLSRVPWAKFLNEKMGPALQKTAEPLLKQYTWPALQFNYPTNADDNGLTPCVTPGNDGTCKQREAAKDSTYRTLEAQISKAFTAELADRLGGKYFCGPTYDPANPNVCPDINIEVVKVSLKDNKPVVDRQALDQTRDAAKNATESAALEQQKQAAALAQKQAELEGAKKIRDLQNADDIDRAKAAKAVLDAQGANNQAAADQDAAKALAPCILIKATPADCALIIAAQNKQYPQGNGGGFTVTPSK